jgi:hypothetical protein
MIYQKKAEKLLADENCMKIILVSLFKVQVNFTNILHTAFLYLHFWFVIFWPHNIGAKAALRFW